MQDKSPQKSYSITAPAVLDLRQPVVRRLRKNHSPGQGRLLEIRQEVRKCTMYPDLMHYPKKGWSSPASEKAGDVMTCQEDHRGLVFRHKVVFVQRSAPGFATALKSLLSTRSTWLRDRQHFGRTTLVQRRTRNRSFLHFILLIQCHHVNR